ncbi:3-isopropylmalate dehydratase large subunit [Candidatus Hecatella orcuttiae]|jgi:3-isopropylmalate/(R)-2-methylmalate dehydratase large subunit|uniref:3-isopropylmalate dehydratase large subunit n=1 Tax=Candidatus Hecatella orcuttiae TaxID=1935119 RepID=UPI00286809E1|nr:3-isopropylmalate dehydratase large subunit [Candidatus Hecatella orcuttiae]
MSSGLTLTEKILARASGLPRVEAGGYVEAEVDLVMMHDLTGPLALDAFERLVERRVWNPGRVVVVFDHQVPADTVRSAELQRRLRRFVAEYGVRNFYDVGKGGICHEVLPEKGHVKPGDLVVGADSHTCTYGALGAFATGVGSTDVAAVLAQGRLWFRVPETVRVVVEGRFQRYVSAKDLILHMAGCLGEDGANYKSLEFTGSTVGKMGMDGRMTLCNMVVELGAKAGLVPPDGVTFRYLEGRVAGSLRPLYPDEGAEYEGELSFSVDSLEPQVACPPRVANVKPVGEVAGLPVDQAVLGSCTNGRMDDLREAAGLLRGRRVKDGVRMIVLPASQEIYLRALEEGLLEVFARAGAAVGPPNCGPCLGGHFGLLAEGEVCISSTNRNFTGRMGSPGAKVYLASPATVAASAVTGRITDPREVGGR